MERHSPAPHIRAKELLGDVKATLHAASQLTNSRGQETGLSPHATPTHMHTQHHTHCISIFKPYVTYAETVSGYSLDRIQCFGWVGELYMHVYMCPTLSHMI